MGASDTSVRRARAATVAVVLVVGAFASVATTSGPEMCPKPTRRVEVSEFYGDQRYDVGFKRWASPRQVTAGSFTLSDVAVLIGSCVASSGADAHGGVRVPVGFDIDHVPAGSAPDRLFASFVVRDGSGLEWLPAAVSIEEAQPAQGRRAAQPAHVGLVFLLPVGIEAPVTLQLGDLDPDRVQPISLDPPAKPTSR